MSIVVKNLDKIFGTQIAVNNVSFQVEKGEIVGFLGPNGAGKSTTMKIMVGYIPASSGEVFINGVRVSVDNLESRKHIGYLPENNPLYTDMYVLEFLEFVGKLYKVKDLKNRVKEIIESVGLEEEQHKKIGMLSKGYKQRVGLAQALIHNPDVLILDEPTTGLDPNQIKEIRTLIKELGKEKTVILSTHIMQEVEAICDRVIIISKGKIVANNSSNQLKKGKEKQYVYVEFDEEITKAQLAKIKFKCQFKPMNDGWKFESQEESDLRKAIASFAKENGWLITRIDSIEKSLEDVFQELTGS